jgi:hypothetical protein
MVEMIKSKEQEHASEFEKVRQKNSDLTEMLDETIDKLDGAEKQLTQNSTRIKECEVTKSAFEECLLEGIGEISLVSL